MSPICLIPQRVGVFPLVCCALLMTYLSVVLSEDEKKALEEPERLMGLRKALEYRTNVRRHLGSWRCAGPHLYIAGSTHSYMARIAFADQCPANIQGVYAKVAGSQGRFSGGP